jgi:hypothetical protein
MSAITETELGGEMVCIVEFSARPRDSENRPLTGPRREFRVGEHVRFVGSFFKDSPADNPTGHMAVFEPLDEGGQGPFVATQSYFVSLDCWAGLERYFRARTTGKHGGGVPDKAARSRRPNAPRARP